MTTPVVDVSAHEAWDNRRRRAAIVVAAFLLAGYVGLFWAAPVLQRWIAFTTVSTDETETVTRLLPDGTLATIGPESSLRYPNKMAIGPGGGLRIVWASGEVSFTVPGSTNPLKPPPRTLSIETEEARILAVGSQFRVKAKTGLTEVWLHEGSVTLNKQLYNEDETPGPARTLTAPGYGRVTPLQVYVITKAEP